MEERRDGSSVTRSCRWLQLFGSRSDRLPPLPTLPQQRHRPHPPFCLHAAAHVHALPSPPPLGNHFTSHSPAAPAPFVHRSYGEAGESADDNWRQRRLRSREPGAARQRRRRLAKQRTGTDRAEELLCCTQHGQGCMASYVVLSFSLFLSLVCA